MKIVLYLFTIFCIMSCGVTKVSTKTDVAQVPAEPAIIDTMVIVNNYKIYPFQVNEYFVAMSPLPGKVSLAEDIATIKKSGITKMITLVSKEELAAKGLDTYFEEFAKAGIEVYHSPIIDFGLPSKAQMDSILVEVNGGLDNHQNVLIHCMGGYGRSGTVMGCYAKKYLNETTPIEYVRAVRGADAIETKEQEQFILDY